MGGEMEPMGARVVCEKPVNPPDGRKTPGGLYLPEKSYEDRGALKVLAVGPDADENIRPGDYVVVKPWSGIVFKEGGKERLLFEADEVVAVVEE